MLDLIPFAFALATVLSVLAAYIMEQRTAAQKAWVAAAFNAVGFVVSVLAIKPAYVGIGIALLIAAALISILGGLL